MIKLTIEDAMASWQEIEQAVDVTPAIDHWCSGPDWVFPAYRGFGGGGEPHIYRFEADGAASIETAPTQIGEMTSSFALLASYTTDTLKVISALEPLWGFAFPLLGSDPTGQLTQLIDQLEDDSWDAIVLPGIQGGVRALDGGRIRGLQLAANLVECVQVSSSGDLVAGAYEGISRELADLGAGYKAWLRRRSSRFRRNLRRVDRSATEAGIHLEDISAVGNVYERITAIERHSWKGRRGSGILQPEMDRMYSAMIDRLQERGRLAALVARQGGSDIGYIVGGIRNGTYRGLQLSYDTKWRDLSVGHWLQHQQLKALANHETAVHTYDLGMEIAYKSRWADKRLKTITVRITKPTV